MAEWVCIREFPAKLAEYVASDAPAAVTGHGRSGSPSGSLRLCSCDRCGEDGMLDFPESEIHVITPGVR